MRMKKTTSERLVRFAYTHAVHEQRMILIGAIASGVVVFECYTHARPTTVIANNYIYLIRYNIKVILNKM